MTPRAFEETVAAVIFERRKIERVKETGDPEKITDVLDKLTCGNRYWAQRLGRPLPFGVMTMIDEMDREFRERFPDKLNRSFAIFRDHYEAISETVHPSMGSFGMYQIRVGNEFLFQRTAAERIEVFRDVLRTLGMCAELLLREAPKLAAVTNI